MIRLEAEICVGQYTEFNTERKQKISIAIQVSTQIMSRYAREYSVKCAVLLLENFVTYKAYIITFE